MAPPKNNLQHKTRVALSRLKWHGVRDKPVFMSLNERWLTEVDGIRPEHIFVLLTVDVPKSFLQVLHNFLLESKDRGFHLGGGPAMFPNLYAIILMDTDAVELFREIFGSFILDRTVDLEVGD